MFFCEAVSFRARQPFYLYRYKAGALPGKALAKTFNGEHL